jgi:hypothetical protein
MDRNKKTQFHAHEFMNIQIKSHQRPKKSERIKEAQHRTNLRSGSLIHCDPTFSEHQRE